GMYISGPNLAFESELGQHFLAAHTAKYGEDPLSAFHAHAYDGANMLFDAVAKVAVVDADGNLYIGRQTLRDALFATAGMEGITGTITCNEYGDCADPQIVINQIQGGEYMPVSK
ncbi:MAG: branched-chain amino acid ABC transporter substrate-binding protein, partial [Chloroflexi bacterium]|nr:branched-chain amino acid ABC transporter substrate-binding protein [Chloroflexota bacterium]